MADSERNNGALFDLAALHARLHAPKVVEARDHLEFIEAFKQELEKLKTEHTAEQEVDRCRGSNP